MTSKIQNKLRGALDDEIARDEELATLEYIRLKIDPIFVVHRLIVFCIRENPCLIEEDIDPRTRSSSKRLISERCLSLIVCAHLHRKETRERQDIIEMIKILKKVIILRIGDVVTIQLNIREYELARRKLADHHDRRTERLTRSKTSIDTIQTTFHNTRILKSKRRND